MVHLIPSLWTWWKIIWSLWTYKTCITSATYQIEDFIVAVIFLFYPSEIANKTSQIENTMVTCLPYPIIKLVHHTLYDLGLFVVFGHCLVHLLMSQLLQLTVASKGQ